MAVHTLKSYVKGLAFGIKDAPDYTWDGVVIGSVPLSEQYLPKDITSLNNKFTTLQKEVSHAVISESRDNITYYDMPSKTTMSGSTYLNLGGMGQDIHYSASIGVHSTDDGKRRMSFYVGEGDDFTFYGYNSCPVIIRGLSGIELRSSSSGSTKRFKITVDDTGALITTEITT